ncbi:hypothetical protein, partial [Pseudomonas tehranensis]|uniref:hypothetical protein n=1 Tax=Pseudomonas tehranensis TaxID=2745502 RepID=UPI001CD81F2F
WERACSRRGLLPQHKNQTGRPNPQTESKLFSSRPITFEFSSGTKAIEKYFHSGAAVCPAR